MRKPKTESLEMAGYVYPELFTAVYAGIKSAIVTVTTTPDTSPCHRAA